MTARLYDMLRYMRPYKSKAEAAWIKKFILPYNPKVLGTTLDAMVYMVMVNNPDGTAPNVLFSAHTDTVHQKGGKQKIVIDEKTGFVAKNDGEPLGADDAAGVWMLLEMIDAGVPGAYTFPVGEERGGIGSSWLADNGAEWLRQFDYAIAFDRKATDSIITHQSRGMCCSSDFANALAGALNDLNDSFMYSPDDSGVYTDTAEYTDLISECTNISCGYYNEHTEKEWLDVRHLVALRDACVKLNWSALPAVRKPGDDGFVGMPFMGGARYTFGSSNDLYGMSRKEMIEMAYYDPSGFVDMIRDDLGIEDEDEDDGLPMKSERDWSGSSISTIKEKK